MRIIPRKGYSLTKEEMRSLAMLLFKAGYTVRLIKAGTADALEYWEGETPPTNH